LRWNKRRWRKKESIVKEVVESMEVRRVRKVKRKRKRKKIKKRKMKLMIKIKRRIRRK
jgi:hypothetical protein